MVDYVPILKGRRGEAAALSNLSPTHASTLRPVFEVVPSKGIATRDVLNFFEEIRDRVPKGLAIGVDVGWVTGSGSDGGRPIDDISYFLDEWGVPMSPVIRLTDDDHRLVSHGKAARRHDQRAYVRLGGTNTTDPDPDDAGRQLPRIWRLTRLDPRQCDLLLDMAEVHSERDLGRATPLARKAVEWGMAGDWRSVTLVAGAMPRTLTGLATNKAVAQPRFDAMLWARVCDRDVNYGDYGLSPPALSGNAWSPMPTLRYTTEQAWWIYRWQREHGGNSAFHELAAALVSSSHWPSEGAAFSWGDRQLSMCAQRVRGPGNATNWVEWGTSHHVAHVITSLNREGKP